MDASPDRDVVAEPLVVYSSGKLSVLSAVDLPDGWMGFAVLVSTPAGEKAVALNRRPDLNGFAGTVDYPASLSETHDTALREEGDFHDPTG